MTLGAGGIGAVTDETALFLALQGIPRPRQSSHEITKILHFFASSYAAKSVDGQVSRSVELQCGLGSLGGYLVLNLDPRDNQAQRFICVGLEAVLQTQVGAFLLSPV